MSDSRRFLFSDDIHIHPRNFGSLFTVVKREKIPTTVHKAHEPLKRALGCYRHRPELDRYRPQLSSLSGDALFGLRHTYRNTPLRLFPLYRAELLAYSLAVEPSWHTAQPARDEATLFAAAYERDRTGVIDNAAAAMFWIDEYDAFFSALRGTYSHAFVFAGSMIYTRVLMELCRLSETRCIALESSFTGHQYYVEERYSPLGAGADIQLPTVREALWGAVAAEDRANLRGCAQRMMFSSRNKNVAQPKNTGEVKFAERDRPELLVVGQVVNDFSLIEQARSPLSSLAFYKHLINECLHNSEYNVVFKAHPWEQRKQHVRHAFTLQALTTFQSQLPARLKGRLHLTSDSNLIALGMRANRAALLSSQAGLELAFHCGLRPSTFGQPFYAGAGFTDDYEHDGLGPFLRSLRGTERSLLSLDDYDRLLDFLACYLGLYCVSTHSGAQAALADRLSAPPRVLPTVVLAARRHPLDRLRAKSGKLLRDPRRFMRDSRLLRRLLAKR